MLQGPLLYEVNRHPMDTYTTIDKGAESQLTEKRSRFLAFAHHAADESEAKSIAAAYKKKYYDARHVCYAYAVGNRGETTRANDDGEPSGTAGRPILGQIQARSLTYAIVVVVRYFGGVKLGTGPLGVAYKTAAADALDLCQLKECIMKQEFRIDVPYADADVAMRFVKEAQADITQRDYTDSGTQLTISVRLDDEQALRDRLSHILSLTFLKEED